MGHYRYRAIDSRGKRVTGTYEGENETVVYQYLKSENLLPVAIEKGRRKFFSKQSFTLEKKLKSRAVSHFCRQMAVVTKSGVNLIKALDMMQDQTRDKLTNLEVGRIYQAVQTGKSISEAMNETGSLMPPLLSSMVATGEASGRIEEMFRNMADYYEREHRIGQKIKSASIYPTIMVVMAIGILTFFFNFLLPQLINMITLSGGELPFITRVVMGIAEFGSQYFFVILFIFSGILLFLSRYFKTVKGRWVKDQGLSRVPVIGKTLKDVTMMHFAHDLYLLMKSGLPLVESLRYIKNNMNNAVAEKAIEEGINGLLRGGSLSDHIQKTGYFDNMLLQMLTIGEETGELEMLLAEMADYYEREANAGFDKILALVEPALLIVIGLVISVVIISVMLPMMDMVRHLKQ